MELTSRASSPREQPRRSETPGLPPVAPPGSPGGGSAHSSDAGDGEDSFRSSVHLDMPPEVYIPAPLDRRHWAQRSPRQAAPMDAPEVYVSPRRESKAAHLDVDGDGTMEEHTSVAAAPACDGQPPIPSNVKRLFAKLDDMRWTHLAEGAAAAKAKRIEAPSGSPFGTANLAAASHLPLPMPRFPVRPFTPAVREAKERRAAAANAPSAGPVSDELNARLSSDSPFAFRHHAGGGERRYF